MTIQRRRLLAPATLAVGLLLAGCGTTAPATPAPTATDGADGGAAEGVVTTDADGVQEITVVTGDDFVFSPSSFTVAPGEVRLTVDNRATQMTHNFLFTPGAGVAEIPEQIPFLAPGQSQTIEFTVTTPGDQPFECSFHTALGQVGTMTVSG